jgi:hypothetical protein
MKLFSRSELCLVFIISIPSALINGYYQEVKPARFASLTLRETITQLYQWKKSLALISEKSESEVILKK